MALTELAAPRHQGTTLERLCADLGPDLIEIVLAPGGIDVPIADAVLHDALEPISRDREPGQLLLAVGLSREGDAPRSLVEAAVLANVAAIACRDVDLWPRELLAAAEAGGLSVLKVPANVDWGDLFELVRAAIAVEGPAPLHGEEESDRRGLDDLFALAEVTAAVAGGPVTIDDMHSQILAFSAISGSTEVDEARLDTILNRRVPERWLQEMRERGIIEHLLTSDEVLHVDSVVPTKRPRRVIAIRLGASVLGSIWLAGDDETLSPEADEALRRAAPIAALQMMRQRVSVGVERRVHESRVAALLRDGDPSPAALKRVGLLADENLVVLAVAGTANRASSPAPVGPRAVDLLSMHLHSYPHPSVASSLEAHASDPSPLDERVYVLTNARGPSDRAALEQFMRECVVYAGKALGVSLRVGIGYEVAVPAEIPLARHSADECLALSAGEESVTVFEQVHDQSLLADVREVVANRNAGASAAYRALVEYDAAHETDFVATLRAILDSFGNAILVAEQLHLHVNSVRYRVKRISEITGVDLGDADARLALELELRARSSRD